MLGPYYLILFRKTLEIILKFGRCLQNRVISLLIRKALKVVSRSPIKYKRTSLFQNMRFL